MGSGDENGAPGAEAQYVLTCPAQKHEKIEATSDVSEINLCTYFV